jgi:hypothetical protein
MPSTGHHAPRGASLAVSLGRRSPPSRPSLAAVSAVARRRLGRRSPPSRLSLSAARAGQFTPEQRGVYEAVLDASLAVMRAVCVRLLRAAPIRFLPLSFPPSADCRRRHPLEACEASRGAAGASGGGDRDRLSGWIGGEAGGWGWKQSRGGVARCQRGQSGPVVWLSIDSRLWGWGWGELGWGGVGWGGVGWGESGWGGLQKAGGGVGRDA